MSFVTHVIAAIFGFSFATALICRVSLRPRARKVLSKVGIVKLHKARVPAGGKLSSVLSKEVKKTVKRFADRVTDVHPMDYGDEEI